ncbi:MAG TPA: glycosyltransferase, partial [Candidatus Baltobacteraceae bacterium]
EGGTESYLERVLPAFVRAGAELTVLARRVRDEGAFGVPVREVGWASDTEPPSERGAAAIARAIEALAPHAVLTSNVFDTMVMSAARRAPKLIVRVHDHRLFCPQGDRLFPHGRTPCARPMGTMCLAHAALNGCAAGVHLKTLHLLRAREELRAIVAQADHLIVSSRFMQRLCVLNGIREEKVVVIPPPIEGDAATVVAPRPARDRIFFAGRLVRDKGVASLIRALGLIPANVRPTLAVAGQPTSESTGFPHLARKVGVAVTMLGRLDARGLNAELDASSAAAMPSLLPEPFGLAGIEAQARGRPVVAYAAGGIPEWMGAGGILVSLGDERALARAILDLHDRERWPGFATAALQQARHCSARAHAGDVLALCDAPREEAMFALS